MADSTASLRPEPSAVGYSQRLQRSASSIRPEAGIALARVVRVDRSSALLLGTDSVESIVRSRSDLAVGDWVWVDERGAIARRLERTNEVIRLRGDGTPQVLGANVDVALLIVDVHNAHRPGLIERLAAVGWESRATPHFVITKCDLATPRHRSDIEAVLLRTAPGIEVMFVSASTNLGRDALEATLSDGRTGMLVGHSGVGKSTLLNWLLEDARAEVGEVRARDAKGRHTTTARRLYPLPAIGGCVIDTPGIRELGIPSVNAIEQLFDDIWELTGACRFSDCAHVRDAGCALRQAVENGDVPTDRYRRFLAYMKEALENRSNPAQRRDKTVEYSRMAREFRSVRGH